MGKRKIVVNGEEWLFSIGKVHVVAQNTVTNERRKTDVSAITGWDWHSIEKSIHKGGGWAVRPRHVAKWLSTPETPKPQKSKVGH